MAKGRRGRNEGSIEKLPSGKWRAILSDGVDEEGNRQKMTSPAFEFKGDAAAWLREKLAERDNGTLARSKDMTVGEWMKKWVEMRKGDSEQATWGQYETHVRVHLTPAFGRIPLADLTALSVVEKFAEMERNGTSAAMRFKLHTTLRTVLKSAVAMNLIAQNVATKVKKPKRVKPLADSWTAEEAKAFAKSVSVGTGREIPSRAMLLLTLDSGMRQGEILGLHWHDVDLEAGAVRVTRSLSELNKVFVLKDVKRDSSRRRIRITRATADAIRDHRERERLQGRDVVRGPVFLTRAGEWVTRSTVNSRFERAVKKAGLRKIRFHDLRHTCATLLIAANVNIKAVSSRLGHASIQITLDTYAHVLPQMDDAIVTALEGVFSDCPTIVPQAPKSDA